MWAAFAVAVTYHDLEAKDAITNYLTQPPQ